MSLTELAVKRPTALVAMFSLLVGLGVFGYFQLGADLFPSTNTPFVGVHSLYPGAGSKEIEKDLVKPMEDAVSSLPGIKNIRSTSGEGYGLTVLQFTMDTDPDTAVMDVQKAIDAIVDNLPADSTRPIVRKYNLGARPILVLSLSGSVPYEELRARAESAQKAIENVNGVGQVSLLGAPKRELQISLDRTALDSYGISLQTLIGVLKSSNLNLPAGLLHQDGLTRTLRVVGEFASVDEIGAFRIPLPRGGSVPLHELASVEMGYPEDSGRIRMDGKSAIGMQVVKASDANVVAVTNRIKKVLAAQTAELPPGMSLSIASDQTTFIESSLSETMRDLLAGIAVTALVLFLFLREWRSSLIVLVAIPTSLVSTFFMMYVLKFTLNIVSTMALALCIGILVDDSIVVLENIDRHLKLGQEPRRAAIDGRREIGMAAIAITLCDVVVFAPVAFLGDLVGQFFRQFGLTVVFATLFSLFVSFTMTPALASRLLGRGRKREEARKDGGEAPRKSFFERRVKGAYRGLLGWALDHRGPVIALVALLFVGSLSLIPLGLVPTEFLPPFDQGKILVDVALDGGADLDRTDAAVAAVEAHLLAMPETRDVFSQIGTDAGQNYAELTVKLKDKRERAKGQAKVARELRAWGTGLPGVEFSVTEQSIIEQTSAEGKKALIINVRGPDRSVIAELASELESIVKATPGAVDVDNSMRSRRTELSVRMDRVALSQYGLLVSDAALALRTALAGTKAGILRSSGDEYDIILRFQPGQVRTPLDIGSIRISNPAGMQISLAQVATIGRDDAPNQLTRSDRTNVATIMANLQGRALGAVTADIQRALAERPTPKGYAFDFKGDTSLMSDSFGSLSWALAASLMLVYLVLLVLYDSFLTPLIRMLSLPAGIIGGIAALALTGKAINIVTFIGIIMLDGLASKNGTLLIDYTNTLVKRGLGLREALIEAGSTRLRPIVMTSMTMIVGMLPLAISSGSSSEIKSGMAILLIGGLVTSTIISPILLPVAYTLIDEARRRGARRRANRPQEALP
ncbi:MAG: efflux RND transporter permease subunit [Rectinemataceae bacterium]|jgi:HAE1 family hydrophobic/amphiphilic exporter-1